MMSSKHIRRTENPFKQCTCKTESGYYSCVLEAIIRVTNDLKQERLASEFCTVLPSTERKIWSPYQVLLIISLPYKILLIREEENKVARWKQQLDITEFRWMKFSPISPCEASGKISTDFSKQKWTSPSSELTCSRVDHGPAFSWRKHQQIST